jgi:hypothetical protein
MKKFLGSFQKRAAAAAMLVIAIFSLQTKVTAQDDKTILGAGSSFINPCSLKYLRITIRKQAYR